MIALHRLDFDLPADFVFYDKITSKPALKPLALQPIDTEPEETSNFFQRNAGRGRGRTGRTTNAPNPLHSNLNASLKNPLKKGDWTEEEEKSKARLRVSVPVPATKPEEKDNRPWRHKDQNEDSQATHDEETPDVASSNPWKMSSAPKSDTPSPTLTVPSTTPLPVIINKSQGLPQTQEPQPIPTPQALSQSQPIPSPHLLEKELSPQEVMQRLQTLNDKWMYIDPSGQERGPFSSTQMEKWLSRNFFKSDLMLRREADQTFLPLARLFLQEQRNPFTLQPLYLWLQPPMTEFKSNLQRYLENQQQRQEQQRQLQQLLTTAKDLSSSQGLPVPQQQPPQSFPIRISSPSVPAPTPLFPNLPGMMPPNLSPQIPNIIPTVPPVSGPPGLTQPIIPGFPMAPLGMPMNSVGVFPPYWNQNPQFLQWQMMMMLQAQQQQTVPVPTAEVIGKENAAPTEHVAEVIEKGSEQIIEQPSTQLAQSALGRESVEEEVVVEEQDLPLKIDSPKPQEATKQQNQKQKPEPAQQAKPAQPQGQKQAAQATKQQPKKQNLVEAGKKQESPIQQQEALKVDTPQKKQDTQKLRNTPDPQAIPKPQQKQPQKQQNQPKQQNQKQNQKQAKQKDAPQPEPVEEPLEEGWFKAEKKKEVEKSQKAKPVAEEKKPVSPTVVPVPSKPAETVEPEVTGYEPPPYQPFELSLNAPPAFTWAVPENSATSLIEIQKQEASEREQRRKEKEIETKQQVAVEDTWPLDEPEMPKEEVLPKKNKTKELPPKQEPSEPKQWSKTASSNTAVSLREVQEQERAQKLAAPKQPAPKPTPPKTPSGAPWAKPVVQQQDTTAVKSLREIQEEEEFERVRNLQSIAMIEENRRRLKEKENQVKGVWTVPKNDSQNVPSLLEIQKEEAKKKGGVSKFVVQEVQPPPVQEEKEEPVEEAEGFWNYDEDGKTTHQSTQAHGHGHAQANQKVPPPAKQNKNLPQQKQISNQQPKGSQWQAPQSKANTPAVDNTAFPALPTAAPVTSKPAPIPQKQTQPVSPRSQEANFPSLSAVGDSTTSSVPNWGPKPSLPTPKSVPGTAKPPNKSLPQKQNTTTQKPPNTNQTPKNTNQTQKNTNPTQKNTNPTQKNTNPSQKQPQSQPQQQTQAHPQPQPANNQQAQKQKANVAQKGPNPKQNPTPAPQPPKNTPQPNNAPNPQPQPVPKTNPPPKQTSTNPPQPVPSAVPKKQNKKRKEMDPGLLGFSIDKTVYSNLVTADDELEQIKNK